ncbi:hypothetical protein LXL04_016755 [Taraxacum kok-saghyz]
MENDILKHSIVADQKVVGPDIKLDGPLWTFGIIWAFEDAMMMMIVKFWVIFGPKMGVHGLSRISPSSPSSHLASRRLHHLASRYSWRTLPPGPPQQQTIDTGRNTAATEPLLRFSNSQMETSSTIFANGVEMMWQIKSENVNFSSSPMDSGKYSNFEQSEITRYLNCLRHPIESGNVSKFVQPRRVIENEIPCGHKIDKISIGEFRNGVHGINTISIMPIQMHPHIRESSLLPPSVKAEPQKRVLESSSLKGSNLKDLYFGKAVLDVTRTLCPLIFNGTISSIKE